MPVFSRYVSSMKTLVGMAVLAAFSLPAAAGVLPIKGSYCNDEESAVDTDGYWSEVGNSLFDKIVTSGSNWWVVSYKGETGTSRIELSPDKQTMTIRTIEPEQRTAAKVAGFLYLFLMVTGVFAE